MLIFLDLQGPLKFVGCILNECPAGTSSVGVVSPLAPHAAVHAFRKAYRKNEKEN